MVLALYILIPKTSDHLFNLEYDPTVALVTTDWELKGKAVVISTEGSSLELNLLKRLDVEWCRLVRVDPRQMQFHRKDGWGNFETIDFPV